MQIVTEQELLKRITEFRERHGNMAPTTFGRKATGEPQLLTSIEGGRSPSLKVVNRIIEFMKAEDDAAATRAKLELTPPVEDEAEIELPFGSAPVNHTGASLPTCSPTNGPQSPRKASASCQDSSTTSGSAAQRQNLSCSGADAALMEPPRRFDDGGGG